MKGTSQVGKSCSLSNSFINSLTHYLSSLETSEFTRTDLDSHADSPVIGRNALILHYTGQTVNVLPFASELGSCNDVPVVQAAVAYDCPYTGQTYIGIVNNALFIERMEHNLIPPIMMRLNGLHVDECPKFLSPHPSIDNHCIASHEDNVRIPLSLYGSVSYFKSRKPTRREVENEFNLVLTVDSPEWDPHSDSYARQEESMTDFRGHMTEHQSPSRSIYALQKEACLQGTKHLVASMDSQVSCVLSEVSPTLVDDEFVSSLKSKVNISHDDVQVSSVKSSSRIAEVTPEELSRRWNIGLDAARRTVRVTTQRGMQTTNKFGLDRRLRYNDRQLRYRRLNTNIFTDTMFSSVTSTRGNTCGQVYVNDLNWTRFQPMKSKSEAHYSLGELFRNDGVPNHIICDGAPEQIGGDFRKKCSDANCGIKQLEADSAFANRAETGVRELKRGVNRNMRSTGAPAVLWDYCAELEAKIRSLTALPSFRLEGEVPETRMTGETADISDVACFKWYDWVMWRNDANKFPEDDWVLGKWLGPSKNVGPAMGMWILNDTGKVVSRQTVRPLTDAEIEDDVVKSNKRKFDEKLKENIRNETGLKIDDDTPDLDPYVDDSDGEEKLMPEVDEINDYDKYISSEVMLPRGGDALMKGTVTARVKGNDGRPAGTYNPNPMVDSRVYEVTFPDGVVQQYAANVIAENMYAQVDEHGHHTLMLDEIIDHKKDPIAIGIDDGYIVKPNGQKVLKKTTKGWKICVQWRDGSTTWVPLKDLKESNPVELAEYAAANKILSEPAFAWWAPFTLKKRDRIIAKLQTRYLRKTHKFGIELPKTVEEAIRLDEANGNDYWRKAIQKEMRNVRVAFNILEDDDKIPRGYEEVRCHMVFDVKMDFTRKARLVAGGHTTDPPATSTYASVVSRESVRIALMLAALNGLDILAGDIQNAYLTAPPGEKIWVRCGPEFGSEDKGKRALVCRALYGLKSSGAAYRNHFADALVELGWTSCKAEPDVWMRQATNDATGEAYYEYLLTYVDDVLAISEKPRRIIDGINKYFKLKPESVGEPDTYLGGKVGKVTIEGSRVTAWSFSSSQYIQEAVKNVEAYLEKRGERLIRKADTPLSSGYRPEVDTSDVLDDDESSYYQSLIGILRWAVELGRVDIDTEVSMMSSFLAMPRKGHLSQVFRIFAYLKLKHNSRLVFDPSYPEIDKDTFNIDADWSKMYGDIKEELPADMPKPLGRCVVMRCFVDADHAGDLVTRRSRTGFIVYLNTAPVYWYSKRQNSIETSTFGSEFVAMKQATEYLRGLRYKLRMMGVPIDGPAYVMGDNQSVLCNTSMPESTLKKKSNSIAYHFVREGVTRGEWVTGYIKTDVNIADVLTKPLPGPRRKELLKLVMFDIYD